MIDERESDSFVLSSSPPRPAPIKRNVDPDDRTPKAYRKVSQKGLASDPVLRPYTAAFRYLWRVHLQGCLRRDILCSITPAEFYTLIKGDCHYCGCAPTNVSKGSENPPMLYNGLDRIDNALPYTAANIVTCCKVCNSMKSRLTRAEFLAHIERIYLRHFD